MNKDKKIEIRVTELQKKRIKAIADKYGMTVSEFMLYGAMRLIVKEEEERINK